MAQSARKIVVAVDFGTTFSSIAFAQSDPREMRLHDEELVQSWDERMPTGESVPTYPHGIAPDQGRFQWGFEVDSDDQSLGFRYEWFKLALQPEAYANSFGLQDKYRSRTPRFDESQCARMIVDYLRSMKRAFDVLMRNRRANQRRTEFIITVPAIWTEKSKDNMRAYAAQAGMGTKGTIQIIKEPEAAGIYALVKMRDLGLELNDTFVLCDAGGGTVDLISYTVSAMDPVPTLTEAAVRTFGGLCGSTYLNRGFEAFLDRRFRGYELEFYDELKPYMMTEFDKNIKKRFMGVEDEKFTILVLGIPDNYHLGISRGKLTISGRDLKPIFSEVMACIIRLVRAQIDATTKNVKKILLGGGFGQSGYLRAELQKAMRSDGRKVDVANIWHSETAVVRGALITGLTRSNNALPYPRTAGRIASKSYGVLRYEDFDRKKGHDPRRINAEWARAENKVETLDWFIRQGTTVDESRLNNIALKCKSHADGTFDTKTIEVFAHHSPEGAEPPRHKTEDMVPVAKLFPKLSDIPRDSLREEPDEYGDMCLWADVDIQSTLNSANLLVCTLIYAGSSRRESVEIEFV